MRNMPIVGKLARAITQGKTPAAAPRTPEYVQHLLTVTEVDTFSGTVGVQFPDPSGATVSGVRFMQAYTPDRPPQVGDVVVTEQYGTDLRVVGQHAVPTNFITPA